MMSINLRFFAILNIKCSDYCFIISLISQKKQNIINKKLLSHIKMGEKFQYLKILKLKKTNFTEIRLRSL